MKRILLLSMLVGMAVVIIACSNSPQQVSNENATAQPQSGEAVKNTPPEVTIKDLEQKSGMDINVSLGKTGENMSLPESFPNNTFPLPEDANIVNVNDNKDAKALGITFKTGKNFEEAVAFYQNVMKGGTITMEQKKDGTYLLMGDKDKYGVMVSVSKYNGDNVSVLLNVTFK